MKNTELADLISSNIDKISTLIKESLTQSYKEPSPSGYTNRIVIFKDGVVKCLLSNGNSYIAELEDEAFALCVMSADINGEDLDSMDEILNQIDFDEQKEYIKWCVDSDIISSTELDDCDYSKIDDPELYKRFNEKNYNEILNTNIGIEVDFMQNTYMDEVNELFDELRSGREII